jgi:hypothetical protein
MAAHVALTLKSFIGPKSDFLHAPRRTLWEIWGKRKDSVPSITLHESIEMVTEGFRLLRNRCAYGKICDIAATLD